MSPFPDPFIAANIEFEVGVEHRNNRPVNWFIHLIGEADDSWMSPHAARKLSKRLLDAAQYCEQERDALRAKSVDTEGV